MNMKKLTVIFTALVVAVLVIYIARNTTGKSHGDTVAAVSADALPEPLQESVLISSVAQMPPTGAESVNGLLRFEVGISASFDTKQTFERPQVRTNADGSLPSHPDPAPQWVKERKMKEESPRN